MGITFEAERSVKPWRVKYKGSTIDRVAYLGQACQVYYDKVQECGASSSRARAHSDDAMEMIDRLDKA